MKTIKVEGLNTMSLDESLREELKRLYLTGHDIGDAGYPEPHKTDDSYIDASLAKIKALIVESLVDGRQISLYHDLYSGKGKEWTDGYRKGFDMCKELVLALWK